MDQARFDWIIKAIDFDKLTDWETQFVESCDSRMKSKGDLTPVMEPILGRIFAEKQ